LKTVLNEFKKYKCNNENNIYTYIENLDKKSISNHYNLTITYNRFNYFESPKEKDKFLKFIMENEDELKDT
jgi:hypothetical protein